MGRRCLAFLTDCSLVAIFAVILAGFLAFRGVDISDEGTRAVGELALIFWLVYMVMATYFTRMTVGKYLLSIEIRSSRPGQIRPAIWELGMRETAFRWMSTLLFLGYIPAFSDSRHRSWSDRWANTVVVRRNVKPRRWIVGLFAFTILGILLLAGLVVLVGWTRY
jgi:hypothetical protein